MGLYLDDIAYRIINEDDLEEDDEDFFDDEDEEFLDDENSDTQPDP